MRPTPPPPYIYANPLPTGAVATVNDEKVTQARLLEYVLNGNLQQAMENLVMANVLELELAKNGIDVTDEEIATERTAIVARVSPGRKPEDLIKEGVFSEFEINRQARMARGWDKIIWKKQNVPEDKRTEQGNPMIRAIFMRQAMQDYDIRRRGSDPAPALGLVAQIVSRDGKGPTISVTADQSLDLPDGTRETRRAHHGDGGPRPQRRRRAGTCEGEGPKWTNPPSKPGFVRRSRSSRLRSTGPPS
jgi:hypothetical protein